MLLSMILALFGEPNTIVRSTNVFAEIDKNMSQKYFALRARTAASGD